MAIEIVDFPMKIAWWFTYDKWWVFPWLLRTSTQGGELGGWGNERRRLTTDFPWNPMPWKMMEIPWKSHGNPRFLEKMIYKWWTSYKWYVNPRFRAMIEVNWWNIELEVSSSLGKSSNVAMADYQKAVQSAIQGYASQLVVYHPWISG